MNNIPDKKVERVQFCESHWPIWTSNAGWLFPLSYLLPRRSSLLFNIPR